MRWAILSLGAILLAGCQSPAVTRAEADQAACRAQPFRTAVERARCLNDASERVLPLAGRNEDLLRVQMARRIVLAEKVDARQITQAEADLQMAEGLSGAISTGQERADTEQALRNQRNTVRALSQPVTVAPASPSLVPAMDFSR